VLLYLIPACLGFSLNVYLSTFTLLLVFVLFVLRNKPPINGKQAITMTGVFVISATVTNPLMLVNRFLPGYESHLEQILVIKAQQIVHAVSFETATNLAISVLNGLTFPIASLALMSLIVGSTRFIKSKNNDVVVYMIIFVVIDTIFKLLLGGAANRFLLVSFPILITMIPCVLYGRSSVSDDAGVTKYVERIYLVSALMILGLVVVYFYRELAVGNASGVAMPLRRSLLERQCVSTVLMNLVILVSYYFLLRRGRIKVVVSSALVFLFLNFGVNYASLLHGSNQYKVARHILDCCPQNHCYLSRYPSYAYHWPHSEDARFSHTELDSVRLGGVDNVIATSSFFNRFLLSPRQLGWSHPGLSRRNDYYVSLYEELFYGNEFAITKSFAPPVTVIDGRGFHRFHPYIYVISKGE